MGPYEYYHNEKDEPMFREYKVRNLAEMFSSEPNYWDYSLEDFKKWLKRKAPEEDWTYINEWGRLGCFDSVPRFNNEIYEYLFQLGFNPMTTYINCLDDIEYYEERMDYAYADEFLEDSKKMLEICKKYMSKEDLDRAKRIKEIVKYPD